MKLGKISILIFFITFLIFTKFNVFAEEKIQTVPLINLEELSPTFEEDKDELEKIDKKKINLNIY